MTETKVIYKEASKETIENLIGNSSKTIEDLYKKAKTGCRTADEHEVYIDRPDD